MWKNPCGKADVEEALREEPMWKKKTYLEEPMWKSLCGRAAL